MRITWYIKDIHSNHLVGLRRIFGLKDYNYDRFLTSIWNRCLQLIPYLDSLGVQSRIDRGNNIDTDVGILIRWHDDEALDLINRLKKNNVITALDLCVNFFDVADDFQGYGVSEKQVAEVKKIAPLVDTIICGSKYIRNKASCYNPNSVYLPESIDFHHFTYSKQQQHFNRDSVRAIWSGQSVKSIEVANLYPLLRERGIPLTIISNARPELPGPYTYIPWSYYTFPQNIIDGDLCISPRRIDSLYNLGHSHFKIGAFLAQGVPAIAAPLPSYVEVIDHTEGGQICNSDSQWASALDEVLENRDLLWKWSQNARKGMLKYSTENVALQYVSLFENLKLGTTNMEDTLYN